MAFGGGDCAGSRTAHLAVCGHFPSGNVRRQPGGRRCAYIRYLQQRDCGRAVRTHQLVSMDLVGVVCDIAFFAFKGNVAAKENGICYAAKGSIGASIRAKRKDT